MASVFQVGKGLTQGRIEDTPTDGSFSLFIGDKAKPIRQMSVGDYIEYVGSAQLAVATTYLKFDVTVDPPQTLPPSNTIGWELQVLLNAQIKTRIPIGKGVSTYTLTAMIDVHGSNQPLTDTVTLRLEVVNV